MREGCVEPMDFIRETGVDIDTLQAMIKHHMLEGYTENNIFYIKAYEIDYFKEYLRLHGTIHIE